MDKDVKKEFAELKNVLSDMDKLSQKKFGELDKQLNALEKQVGTLEKEVDALKKQVGEQDKQLLPLGRMSEEMEKNGIRSFLSDGGFRTLQGTLGKIENEANLLTKRIQHLGG